MDPMTMMMIASAASSLLGGMGKGEEDDEDKLTNPFQKTAQTQLMGFPSMSNNPFAAQRGR